MEKKENPKTKEKNKKTEENCEENISVRTRLNYLIDISLIISFLINSISALIIFFFLPSGVRQGRYQLFLGITKGFYSSTHEISGIIFITLVIIHLLLHWKWLIYTSKNFFKRALD
ncbi:MAG: DUF4405 domain-containing protein [Candidatus Pacearchaeota archaeon]